jgi:hypothetical protein
MLAALFKLPQNAVRSLIVWALGGEPLLKQPDPPYDPAGIDAVAAELKNP